MVSANRILSYRSHPYAIPAILAVAFITLLFLFIPHNSEHFTPPSSRPGAPAGPVNPELPAKITHIVLFSFAANLPWSVKQSISSSMLNLATTCLHPATGKPYIRSGIGGTDNSPEGLQAGYTHVFVVEFESEEDRNYYVNEDPVHKKFKEGLKGKVEKALVVDFEKGIFLQTTTETDKKGLPSMPGAGEDE
ncbi:hypothetical protein BJ508DRAFT_300589 [Ascobolus immersus RN42]|uniref:Stress-response A/B barrel domain-containing protein n=1 Tax=Ascobolus immersus RN42 TaxID=1160509 RepID=A0A3N4IR90_ASCIM|nr:hypothetical protein BJ508DRAFT_300589 [Ascobolus immersus RN42]